MPYDFWIPTAVEEWTLATLTEDGQLILHDYNLERDETAEALGFEPSTVLKVVWAWEEDPIALLCGKDKVLPFRDTALAAFAWAQLAVAEGYDDNLRVEDPKSYAIIENALEVAWVALNEKKSPHKPLVKARKDVTNLITRKLSNLYGDVVDVRTGAAMHSVKLVLNGIIAARHEKSFFGKDTRTTSTISFCNAGYAALKAIRENFPSTELPEESDYDRLVEVAVRVLVESQEAAGAPRRPPPDWG